jgi:hypothetical protein
MSRSPEAYPHTPTAYQTNLSSEAHDAGTHATICNFNDPEGRVMYLPLNFSNWARRLQMSSLMSSLLTVERIFKPVRPQLGHSKE